MQDLTNCAVQFQDLRHRMPFTSDSVSRHFADRYKKKDFSVAKRQLPNIHVKITGIIRSSPHFSMLAFRLLVRQDVNSLHLCLEFHKYVIWLASFRALHS